MGHFTYVCVTLYCELWQYMEESGCKFHYFPKRKYLLEQRNKWINAVRTINADGTACTPRDRDVIYNQHFIVQIKSNNPQNLRYVPTIFPTIYKRRNPNDSQLQRRFERTMNRKNKNIEVKVSNMDSNEKFVKYARASACFNFEWWGKSHDSNCPEPINQVTLIVAVKKRGLLDIIFSPCKCKCGIPNREARLLGGEYLRSHEFPWSGLIQLRESRSAPATLINDRYLITAANNVLGLTPLDVKITIGQFDRCFPDVSSTNMSIEKIVIHPDFSPGNRAHDLALLKLSAPLKIERRISPVCLSTPNTNYLGQVATVSAWSEDQTEDGAVSTSCRPRKIGLPVLGKNECLNAVAESQNVGNDKGCLGIIGLPSPICRVDSGGPVMFRSRQGVYELFGILTDVNECNPKPGVALYTNINDHLSWISQNTKEACYCFKT